MKSIQEIINERHRIVLDYCKSKNWNPQLLTMDQVIEIRKTEKWINVTKPEKE